MVLSGGEMLATVSELLSSGLECCSLREDQESPVTVAAVLRVAEDIRDVLEISSAQLVSERDPWRLGFR